MRLSSIILHALNRIDRGKNLQARYVDSSPVLCSLLFTSVDLLFTLVELHLTFLHFFTSVDLRQLS